MDISEEQAFLTEGIVSSVAQRRNKLGVFRKQKMESSK